MKVSRRTRFNWTGKVPEGKRARIIAERDRLLAREEALGRAVGLSDAKLAESYGISRSTLYRWLATESKNAEEFSENLDDVSDSIKVLTNDGADEWDVIAAVANFSAWLVFPRSNLNRRARTLSLVAMRLAGPDDNLRTINQLPVAAQRAVGRFLSLGFLRSLSLANEVIWGEFDYVAHRNTGFTDRDILKAVGNEFFKAKSRREVSLNKVELLLEDGDLLPGIRMNASAFSSFWKKYASTIPYLKAEEATGTNWHLTFDTESRDRFFALAGDAEAAREFFRLADRYVKSFRSVLDRRAWNRLAMPFPNGET